MLSIPRQLFRPFRRFRLQVRELPQHFLDRRLPPGAAWDDIMLADQPLEFSGLQLAHAVVRADFLDRVNPLLPGLGFLLSTYRLIDWTNPEFGLLPNSSDRLADFVCQTFAGRLGQGMAILFANRRGLAFSGHLPSLLDAQAIPIHDTNGKRLPIADFVFEDFAGGRTIIEAKGSFSKGANCVKATAKLLRKAHSKQVAPWIRRIRPNAKKTFATAAYVRENSQGAVSASCFAFVDPENEEGSDGIELDADRFLRRSYAAWLRALMLDDAAVRLETKDFGEPRPILFFVVSFGGREIAFPFSSVCWATCVSRLSAFWNRETDVPYLPGIEVSVLRAISHWAHGERASTGSLEGIRAPLHEGGGYEGSLFPDGTYFGLPFSTAARDFWFLEIPL